MEEWEEPLHPGSLPRRYPTLSHDATLIAHVLPQLRRRGARRRAFGQAPSANPPWEGVADGTAVGMQHRLPPVRSGADLQRDKRSQTAAQASTLRQPVPRPFFQEQ